MLFSLRITISGDEFISISTVSLGIKKGDLSCH